MVIGSMRNGNSAFMAEAIQKTIPEITTFTLGNGINYCTGCLECDELHECVIHDRMDDILSSIISSDALIIITPVRYSLMSGDVKVFIDRLNPTAVSESIVGKDLFIIAIGQTDESEGTIQEAIDSLKMFSDNAGLNFVAGYPVFLCYASNDLKEKENDVAEIVSQLRSLLQ